MPIPDGLRHVDSALKEFYCPVANAFHLPRPLQTLVPDATARARQTGTVFPDCAASCDVDYAEGHHEIVIWHISLKFAEYVAGMLELKAKDGHFRSHQKPCALTRDLHRKTLRRFKADLEGLIREIDNADKASTIWPPVGQPPAGPPQLVASNPGPSSQSSWALGF
jgi:hypothetical protein